MPSLLLNRVYSSAEYARAFVKRLDPFAES